jgi:DNA-binding PadR family transcriptional regulator
MLKHGILGLLSYGEMTGYEVMEVFRDSLSFFWTAQTSQIYRELNTLETCGLVQSHIEPQAGKPDRRVYAITPAGREELRGWLAKPFTRQAREPLLMQAFFMGALPPEEAMRRFAELEAFCLRFHEGLTAADAAVGHHAPNAAHELDPLFWEMTVDYGRRYTQMIAEWSADCRARLAEAQAHWSEGSEA